MPASNEEGFFRPSSGAPGKIAGFLSGQSGGRIMIFITGGARSGKSALAEKFAGQSGGPITYIATARAGDREMHQRISEHRSRRPGGWETVEAQSALPEAVTAALDDGGMVLIDCLTVYISNLLLTQGLGAGDRVDRLIDAEMERLAGICAEHNGRVILVSNEVGMGIVPDNALGRAFRDIAGRANQTLAAVADSVYLCVSGIPLKVK